MYLNSFDSQAFRRNQRILLDSPDVSDFDKMKSSFSIKSASPIRKPSNYYTKKAHLDVYRNYHFDDTKQTYFQYYPSINPQQMSIYTFGQSMNQTYYIHDY